MEINKIIEIGLPILTALVVWFGKDKLLFLLNLKKEENNVENGQLQNVQKALDLWQEMLDDAVRRHKLQVNELESIIVKVKNDLKQLQEISDSKDALIIEQKELIRKQSKTIAYYKEKYEKNK